MLEFFERFFLNSTGLQIRSQNHLQVNDETAAQLSLTTQLERLGQLPWFPLGNNSTTPQKGFSLIYCTVKHITVLFNANEQHISDHVLVHSTSLWTFLDILSKTRT